MRKFTLFLIVVLCSLSLTNNIYAQSIGINHDNLDPNPNAILDIDADDKGILIPRMTTLQRNQFALSLDTTETGMMIFDTDEDHFYFWQNDNFRRISLSSSIIDNDLDTEIKVEENPDDDIIRFYTGGKERWTMEGNRIEPQNNQGQIFIGEDAGETASGSNIIGIGTAASRFNNISSSLGIGDSTLMNNGVGSTVSSHGTNMTAIGHQVLKNNTLGHSNTGFGYLSLSENRTGNYNTGLGPFTLGSNISGHNNTAVGFNALRDNTIGNRNTGVGHHALLENTDGEDNTALGYLAMFNNQNGDRNVAIGSRALQFNLGDRNVALGNRSLVFNSTGFGNIGVGNAALYLNTNANGMIAVGDSCLANFNDFTFFGMVAVGNKSQQENRTGRDNTSLGTFALHDNRSGDRNTAVGNFSLYLNRGDNSTAVGNNALANTTSGDENTAVGSFAISGNTSRNRRTAIGYSANSLGNNGNNTGLGNNADCTAAHQVRIGNQDVTSIGGYANWTNISDGDFKKDVQENVVGLDFIKQLRPVTYKLDLNEVHRFFLDEYGEDKHAIYLDKSEAGTMTRSGFIAQEVESAAMSLGYDFSGVDAPKNEKDYYGLRYAAFVVPLVKAVQEQQDIIESQEEAIINLQSKILAIENLLLTYSKKLSML